MGRKRKCCCKLLSITMRKRRVAVAVPVVVDAAAAEDTITCVAVDTVAEEVDTIINEEAVEVMVAEAEEAVILIKEEVDSVEEVADLVHADADLLILSTIINKIIRIKINISHHRISKHRHRTMDSNNSRNLKHFLYNETIEVKIIINDIELYTTLIFF